MFTWHFTFGTQPAVHDLAASYQAKLKGPGTLDLIPATWLHLTTQGVGFTDEVGADDIESIVKVTTSRLYGWGPEAVTLGPAVVTPEAILLKVAPVSGLAAIRGELRAAITGVLGAGRLMEDEDWTPHVSVAYSNATGPMAPYVAAVAGGPEAQATIGDVHLITLGRDQHMYEWTTRATVALTAE